MTKADVIAAIKAEIDSANQRAARSAGHELANASWFVHGLEIALQIVEQLRGGETQAIERRAIE